MIGTYFIIEYFMLQSGKHVLVEITDLAAGKIIINKK